MTTQTVKPICDPNKKTTVDNKKTYSYSRTVIIIVYSVFIMSRGCID